MLQLLKYTYFSLTIISMGVCLIFDIMPNIVRLLVFGMVMYFIIIYAYISIRCKHFCCSRCKETIKVSHNYCGCCGKHLTLIDYLGSEEK